MCVRVCEIRHLRERHIIKLCGERDCWMTNHMCRHSRAFFSLDVCAISYSVGAYHTYLYNIQLFCKLLTYKLSSFV